MRRLDSQAIILIAVGGFAGATVRYGLGAVSGEALAVTLAVNAAGCFLLGMLLFGTQSSGAVASRLRFALGTGFAASFTTYSTFIADITLAEPTIASLYFLGSYATGIGAILLSRVLVEWSENVSGGRAP